jgi:hypothetical protein
MRFRKLRIAWSVGCGIACVLLIVLWVRSYESGIVLNERITKTHALSLVSQRGFCGALLLDPTVYASPKWGLSTGSPQRWGSPSWDFAIHSKSDRYVQVMVPWWFVVLSGAIMSIIAQQLKWRFSLRTLLIATTLVALVLGAIVYAARQ